MKRCLIITGGTLDLDFAGNFLKNHSFEKVIAVDAGLKQTEDLGVMPDLIVGDFDTVDQEVLARFRAMEHMMWDVHQPEKDETDTELAPRKATTKASRPHRDRISPRRAPMQAKMRSTARTRPSAIRKAIGKFLRIYCGT